MSESLSDLHTILVLVGSIITLVVLIALIVGSRGKRAYGSMMVGSMLVLGAATTVQWLVGLGLVLAQGSAPNWGHILPMTGAVVVSHLHLRWQGSPDAVRYRTSLLSVVGLMLLIAIGVALLIWS